MGKNNNKKKKRHHSNNHHLILPKLETGEDCECEPCPCPEETDDTEMDPEKMVREGSVQENCPVL
jgi:hypothetical protein